MTADATLRASGVDASMRVELSYPGGVTGHCRWDMDELIDECRAGLSPHGTQA